MARRVFWSANAQRMLTLLGTVWVRSYPAMGGCPSLSARMPAWSRLRPVSGFRRSLMSMRTVSAPACRPVSPPSSLLADPIHRPGGLPSAL